MERKFLVRNLRKFRFETSVGCPLFGNSGKLPFGSSIRYQKFQKLKPGFFIELEAPLMFTQVQTIPFWPITTNARNPMNQSEHEANFAAAVNRGETPEQLH